MSFKKGDQVKCVRGLKWGPVQVGSQFKVWEMRDGFVYLENVVGGWDADRFLLIKRPLQTSRQEVYVDGQKLEEFPEVKATNPKDGAATSRLDLTLFPDTAVAYGAMAFTEGHLKYGGYNWREAGVSANVYIAALRRHIARWYNGEEDDPDTGVSHLSSALACLAVLVDAKECDKLNDDRPPKAPLTSVLKKGEETTKKLQGKFKNGPPRHKEKK